MNARAIKPVAFCNSFSFLPRPSEHRSLAAAGPFGRFFCKALISRVAKLATFAGCLPPPALICALAELLPCCLRMVDVDARYADHSQALCRPTRDYLREPLVAFDQMETKTTRLFAINKNTENDVVIVNNCPNHVGGDIAPIFRA